MIVRHTADDEEPLCMRCDNLGDSIKFCTKNCGPEHAWGEYLRVVQEDKNEDSEVDK